MQSFNNYLLSKTLVLILISFFSSFFTYYSILISKKNFLGFLNIRAEKSPSNAKLLGGIGVSVGTLFSFLYLNFTFELSPFFSSSELSLIYYSTFSLAILTIAGYLDDRIEIRARFKLFFQAFAIIVFSFFYTKISHANHPSIFLPCSIVFGFLLLNGTNLLDGLDTMTIKMGTAISLSFIIIGVQAQSATLIFISASTISTLIAFYFFNKYPAKIYMGEIGGAVIGFLFFLQSTIAFNKLNENYTSLNSISYIVIACAMPICELGISFLRRILMKKSPFRGDKLHLHYIYKAILGLSPSMTSNHLSIMLLSLNLVCFSIASFVSAFVGAGISILTITSFYTAICIDEWISAQKSNTTENLLLLFENKTVHVIDSNEFKTVHLKLKVKENKTKKKAA